jgi:PAS domain S-box-containing protein
MDLLELVQSTGDPAFATDEDGRIVIWNRAAERLLGYAAARVLGKPCHEILCGQDLFGNRFCDENCSLTKMVRREEPIRRFQMDIRTVSGSSLRVELSALCVRGPRQSQFTLIHLVRPADVAGSREQPFSEDLVDVPATSGPPTEQSPLTARELQVLRHLAEGMGTREIADTLHISVTTVRTHVQNVLGKLELHSQTQAVAWALRNRLI